MSWTLFTQIALLMVLAWIAVFAVVLLIKAASVPAQGPRGDTGPPGMNGSVGPPGATGPGCQGICCRPINNTGGLL